MSLHAEREPGGIADGSSVEDVRPDELDEPFDDESDRTAEEPDKD